MLKRMTLTRIRVATCGKFCGLLSIILGGLVGVAVVMGQFVLRLTAPELQHNPVEFMIASALLIGIGPLLLGLVGWVLGMLLAVSFNLIADGLGGLDYEVDDQSEN